ncbi:MAG: aspartate kinase [Alphaproteobacteria bacterium]|nr:aspartate kinase [Alphaproteobacteria bacterium]
MQIVVKKFGGTSLANVDNIHHVANVIQQSQQKQPTCVVVVSAMAGTTNNLQYWCNELGGALGPNPDRDLVLSSGEMITAGLLSLALQSRGVPARAWTGWQVPIVTNEDWGRCDAVFTGASALQSDLASGVVPVVCGFQGVTPGGRITTLGRGGSDTTAVILAAALKANVCEIFTDVQGVYTADPSYVPDARAYGDVSYDAMLTLSHFGAKVLHANAIIWAKNNGIPVHVLSTAKPDQSGTWIREKAQQVCGVVYKPVLSWRMNSLPDQKQDMTGVSIIDRSLSAKGFHFLTWVDDYHAVKSQWPDATCSDPKMLVSLIGSSSHTAQCALRNPPGILIEHCVQQPNILAVMVEQKHTYDMIRHVHTHLV